MDAIDRRSIVVVDNSIAVTGALKAVVNSCICLSSNYNFIFVIPKSSLAFDYLKSQGFTVYELSFIEISKSLRKLLLYIPYLILNSIKLKAIVRRHRACVLHMNDFYNMAGIGAKLLGLNAILVTHVRFLPQRFYPVLAKFWKYMNMKFSSKIICVSEAVRKYFPTSPNILVISDSVPVSERHPQKIVVGQPSSINLLYLSNYIPGKGQEYALQAFYIAYQQFPNLHLHFAGGDMGLVKNKNFKKNLMDDVALNGYDDVIHFLPFIEDVEKLIKEADILLNFSESESFSLTCLDALFYGTPLIASDCGGPAELFVNGISGILVPNRDIHAMADAIVALASSVELRRNFSKEAKIFVNEKFSLQKNIARLGSIYDSYI